MRRVLVLHGKYQDGEKMRAFVRSASLRVADLLRDAVFLPAPFVEMPKVAAAAASSKKKTRRRRTASPTTLDHPEQFRVWWRDGREREDFETCKGFLRPYLEEADVIVGFSQGAALASLLMTRPVAEELSFNPKLAILCAGYPLQCEWSQALLEQGICAAPPPRVVMLAGSTDRVVHADQSRELALLIGADVLLHAGGHRFARDNIIDERITEEAIRLNILDNKG